MLLVEDLERAKDGIDHPGVLHGCSCIPRELADKIELRGGGGQNFTDPIGCKLEGGGVRDLRHALPPPASQIRNQHILPEVELWLVHNPPATRSAAASLERAA